MRPIASEIKGHLSRRVENSREQVQNVVSPMLAQRVTRLASVSSAHYMKEQSEKSAGELKLWDLARRAGSTAIFSGEY